MSDINNDALALFKRLQIEERARKDEEKHGPELPLEISKYLDSTPAYELKEEFTRFKKQVAKHRNDNWNKQHQVNKELIPGFRKWKTDTHQVIASIYKYSENTIIQARATTEIYEQLLYLQGKIQLENPEDKEIFDGTIDQAAKLATLGFGQAKFQDNDARNYATKAFRLPASMQLKESHLKRIEQTTLLTKNLWQTSTKPDFSKRLLYNNMDVLMEEEDSEDQTEII
ncbi:hypothetical protein RMCBS344292_15616 [Rhizopus microsporus]|nr:hypothetical protein RMCBS344292_15616 [Rhizopus microsporus]